MISYSVMVNSVIQKVFVADVSHRQPFHTIFSLAQMQTDRQGARQSPSGDGGQWRSSVLKGLLSETVTKCIKIIEMLRNRYLYVTASNYMSLNCYKFAMKPIQKEVSNLKPSFSGSMLNFLSGCVYSLSLSLLEWPHSKGDSYWSPERWGLGTLVFDLTS